MFATLNLVFDFSQNLVIMPTFLFFLPFLLRLVFRLVVFLFVFVLPVAVVVVFLLVVFRFVVFRLVLRFLVFRRRLTVRLARGAVVRDAEVEGCAVAVSS